MSVKILLNLVLDVCRFFMSALSLARLSAAYPLARRVKRTFQLAFLVEVSS